MSFKWYKYNVYIPLSNISTLSTHWVGPSPPRAQTLSPRCWTHKSEGQLASWPWPRPCHRSPSVEDADPGARCHTQPQWECEEPRDLGQPGRGRWATEVLESSNLSCYNTDTGLINIQLALRSFYSRQWGETETTHLWHCPRNVTPTNWETTSTQGHLWLLLYLLSHIGDLFTHISSTQE